MVLTRKILSGKDLRLRAGGVWNQWVSRWPLAAGRWPKRLHPEILDSKALAFKILIRKDFHTGLGKPLRADMPPYCIDTASAEMLLWKPVEK